MDDEPMRLEMETRHETIWIEDYDHMLFIQGEDSSLLTLTVQQAQQLLDIIKVWVASEQTEGENKHV